jgi:hypothetical protein
MKRINDYFSSDSNKKKSIDQNVNENHIPAITTLNAESSNACVQKMCI